MEGFLCSAYSAGVLLKGLFNIYIKSSAYAKGFVTKL